MTPLPSDDELDHDVDLDDEDLVDLFRAREAALPEVVLDVAAVHARAAELRATARRTWAARVATRVATAFRERNGAWMSSVGGLAAAACLLVGVGVHESRLPPEGDHDATVGFCAAEAVVIEAPAKAGNLLSAPVVSRPEPQPRMSTDVGVSDARIVTCTLFGP